MGDLGGELLGASHLLCCPPLGVCSVCGAASIICCEAVKVEANLLDDTLARDDRAAQRFAESLDVPVNRLGYVGAPRAHPYAFLLAALEGPLAHGAAGIRGTGHAVSGPITAVTASTMARHS